MPGILSTPFALPPQEVYELGVDIGVHLLGMPVGVADTEVLAPAPKNRVQRPNFLLETVDVVVPGRITDLVSDAAHRFRRRPAIAEVSFRVLRSRSSILDDDVDSASTDVFDVACRTGRIANQL